MHAIYPVKYHDRFGKEQTSILNDGKTLSMTVRGVEFQGTDWDSLEPLPMSALVENQFVLQGGSLCSCKIEVEMPVPVVISDKGENGTLEIEIELGDPLPNGNLNKETLLLKLRLGNEVLSSSGRSGWFEDEMLDLQRKLPEGTLIKACINCAFSDYSPAGHGFFGCLACFRGNKAGYRGVTSKWGLFKIWDTMTEFVQETYLCPEFEKRAPGTGYRG
jgi:hypothetical protein